MNLHSEPEKDEDRSRKQLAAAYSFISTLSDVAFESLLGHETTLPPEYEKEVEGYSLVPILQRIADWRRSVSTNAIPPLSDQRHIVQPLGGVRDDGTKPTNNQTTTYIKATSSWDRLTTDEKLDRLTEVLTRAGSDVEFRNRCLASSESAKQAVREVANIEFPEDFRVQFVTPEERLKTLVLAVPDLIATEDGTAETRNAEDFQVSAYHLWRS